MVPVRQAKVYERTPEIQAMVGIRSAYETGNIKQVEEILRVNQATILDDPFIRKHLDEILTQIRYLVVVFFFFSLSLYFIPRRPFTMNHSLFKQRQDPARSYSPLFLHSARLPGGALVDRRGGASIASGSSYSRRDGAWSNRSGGWRARLICALARALHARGDQFLGQRHRSHATHLDKPLGGVRNYLLLLLQQYIYYLYFHFAPSTPIGWRCRTRSLRGALGNVPLRSEVRKAPTTICAQAKQ